MLVLECHREFVLDDRWVWEDEYPDAGDDGSWRAPSDLLNLKYYVLTDRCSCSTLSISQNGLWPARCVNNRTLGSCSDYPQSDSMPISLEK